MLVYAWSYIERWIEVFFIHLKLELRQQFQLQMNENYIRAGEITHSALQLAPQIIYHVHNISRDFYKV